jgi:hypothetical protein
MERGSELGIHECVGYGLAALRRGWDALGS